MVDSKALMLACGFGEAKLYLLEVDLHFNRWGSLYPVMKHLEQYESP